MNDFKLDHISVSQARTWMKCQMQWFHKYVLKAPARYGVRMALGIGVHAGIAQVNAYRQRGVKADMDQVLSVQEQTFDKEFEGKDYRFDDVKTPEEAKRRAERIIRAAVPQIEKITALPMLIEHPVDGITFANGVKLSGFVDLVDINGSIYDFKVGKPKSQKDADQDLQLSLYRYAIHGSDDQPTKTTLVSIDSKVGDVKPAESSRTGRDAENAVQTLYAVTEQITTAVETETFVPNTEGWWCSSEYCEYHAQCPFGGGGR